MIYKYFLFIVLFLYIYNIPAFSQNKVRSSFRIVPLGVKGGIDESNLSAYMVAAKGTNDYICLDAGTIHYGIEKAISNKVFNIAADQVIKKYIKGYFISHAHLDHIAGLIINSPDDSTKTIYGLASCIETIKTHYFTWESWANFTDEGETPLLKKYHYNILVTDSATSVEGTKMIVQSFPLSHSNLQSTAFLIKDSDTYLLYLGDTGADEIEKSNNLHLLWKVIAPLIIKKQLKGILIETSFPDQQPDKLLFGHLTPHWLMEEMNDLASLTGKGTLKGFKVIITHIKPPQIKINLIKKQLKSENVFQLHLIFPKQGKVLNL